jgi:hypothetical protein
MSAAVYLLPHTLPCPAYYLDYELQDLSLFLIQHHSLKTHVELQEEFCAFVISALDAGEWCAEDPVRYLHSANESAIPKYCM